MFNAGAKLQIVDGKLVIEKEGKLKKLVKKVEHVTFSGRARSLKVRTSLMSPSAA